ncbi:small multidrug resistance pump [Microbacterium foliorum]|uniref:Small multidrug resistance pump n=1 Tax=Microbacterium foliorum TaxID=104336 RepID=A0ABU1HVK4_9MICO|nr:SMR family transporter [Microbacterium foliorum]MDR6144096.1 small multidrug resistance pump [Microbacterium foliorum]
MTPWLLLAVAIVLEVTAALSLRASDGLRKRIWILPLAVCYLGAFGLLTAILAMGPPIGIVYGVWAASGVALTAIGARVFFREALTKRMGLGIAVIAAGVFLISIGNA